MNLDKIYVGREGRQHGPYTLAELRQYVAEERVGPEDSVWCEGMTDWRPLAEVPELQHCLRLPESADVKVREDPAPPAEAAYFHVAAWKFVVLSLATFRLYELYWFYQNWSYIRRRDWSGIWPFWRTVFSPIWCFALCRDVDRHGGSISPLAAIAIALGYVGISALAQLPEPWWLLSLTSFAPLLLVVRQVNAINRARGVRAPYYSRFTAGHVVLSMLGLGLLSLAVLTLLSVVPSNTVLTGDEISARDRQFLREKNIVFESERILFFYSAGVFSVREEGNIVTDRRVISYSQVPDSEDILAKSATFADIEDIRIERSHSFLNDTRITIVTRQGPEFNLVFPTTDKGDERVVARLMTLWQTERIKK